MWKRFPGQKCRLTRCQSHDKTVFAQSSAKHNRRGAVYLLKTLTDCSSRFKGNNHIIISIYWLGSKTPGGVETDGLQPDRGDSSIQRNDEVGSRQLLLLLAESVLVTVLSFSFLKKNIEIEKKSGKIPTFPVQVRASSEVTVPSEWLPISLEKWLLLRGKMAKNGLVK